MSEKYLISIAIGPVQDFIASARRSRDLWFGSWLLSELSKAAAEYIDSQKGELIFPSSLSGNVVNKYSVNATVGYSAGNRIFEFGGLGNINRGNVSGLQIATLLNVVKYDMRGIQIAGIVNKVGAARGLQIAGITNAADILRGAQMSFVNNYAVHGRGGLQIAGIVNKVSNGKTTIQISGMTNSADTVGVQIGLINSGLFILARVRAKGLKAKDRTKSPAFEKRIGDAIAQLLRQQIDPWAFFNTGHPTKLTAYDGSSIGYSGVGFEGSLRLVFWSRYIEPFLENLVVEQTTSAAREARAA